MFDMVLLVLLFRSVETVCVLCDVMITKKIMDDLCQKFELASCLLCSVCRASMSIEVSWEEEGDWYIVSSRNIDVNMSIHLCVLMYQWQGIVRKSRSDVNIMLSSRIVSSDALNMSFLDLAFLETFHTIFSLSFHSNSTSNQHERVTAIFLTSTCIVIIAFYYILLKILRSKAARSPPLIKILSFSFTAFH